MRRWVVLTVGLSISGSGSAVLGNGQASDAPYDQSSSAPLSSNMSSLNSDVEVGRKGVSAKTEETGSDLERPPERHSQTQISPPKTLNEPVSPPAPRMTDHRLAQPIDIFVLDRNLETVLSEISRLGGFRIRINDRLDEVILSRERLSGTLREVLEQLARRYNLSWFAERDLIDVSKADTATVKTFNIGRVTDAQIRDAMARYGLVNADFAIEVDEKNQVARVFAPPRLTSRLESIIVGLKPPQPATGSADIVNVIRYGLVERVPLSEPERPPSPASSPAAAPARPSSLLQGLFGGTLSD